MRAPTNSIVCCGAQGRKHAVLILSKPQENVQEKSVSARRTTNNDLSLTYSVISYYYYPKTSVIIRRYLCWKRSSEAIHHHKTKFWLCEAHSSNAFCTRPGLFSFSAFMITKASSIPPPPSLDQRCTIKTKHRTILVKSICNKTPFLIVISCF